MVAFAIGSLGVWEKISKIRFSKTPKLPAAKAITENKKSRQRPTLARASPALPSAMEPLTSVFGMGTGVTTPLWPPAKNRYLENSSIHRFVDSSTVLLVGN